MSDPTYKNLARIKDNTNNVIFQIKATGLESSKTLTLTSDVSGSATFDLTDNVTIAVSIVNGSVTHDKLGTDSVQNDKILDGTIGLAKLASAVFGNSDVATDNDGHVATHAQVVAYVTRLLQGYGQNYGVLSVASINAMTLDNLHNGDLVIVGGIDAEHPANTITLGNLTVRNGENLIFHKEGTGASTTGVWQSIDGEFKLIQTAYDTDSGSGSGKGGTAKTLTRLQQNSNGDITATFSDISIASSQVNDKMSTYDGTGSDKTKLVTGEAVKAAIDTLDAEETSTDGTNLQVKVTEAHGKVTAVSITTDNTENRNNKVTSWSGTPTDTNYPSEKLVKDSLDAIGSQSSSDAEVIAESLNDLDSRVKALEEADPDTLGNATSDSLDTQVLKIGGDRVVPGTATPQDVASSSAVGSSTNFAREDHRHKISVGTGDSEGQVKVSGQNATVNGWSGVSSKAGSAIQGVKVDGSTLTPDSDRVVSIPAASASAHGTVQFMSSAEAKSMWEAAWAAASAT